MDIDDMLYIENKEKEKLFYRFTPAVFISNFVPLVVLLDAKDRTYEKDFEYKMWNVLTPLSTPEYDKDLLQELVFTIAQEYECEEHIYFYSDSMNGFEAIYQGILCKANAIYADISYFKESKLRSLLSSKSSFAILYLCSNKEKLENETENFLDECRKYGLEVNLNICPNNDENKENHLKKILDMFERVHP